MELTIYIAGILVELFWIVMCVFSLVTHHRDLSLWSGCCAVICLVIGAFATYQNVLWKHDKEAANASAPTAPNPIGHHERAQIVVIEIKGEPENPAPKDTILVHIVIKNTGQTPAKNCRGSLIMEIVGKDSTPRVKDVLVPFGVLGPDVQLKNIIATKRGDSGEELPMTKEGIEQITKDGGTTVVHGRIEYQDVSGNDHWITFSYFMSIPYNGTFGVSKDGNEMD